MPFRVMTVSALMLAALVALAPPAQAWEPPSGGVFNNPQGSYDARWRVIRHVNQAIANTPPGARILFSTFLFTLPSSADALLDAHARGVQVQAVVDGEEGRTVQSQRVAARLNADNGNGSQWGPDNSFLVFCSGSCRGPGTTTNNHAKFYLFSQTGTAENVVMVGSSNLNRGAAVRGWNDLYTTSGVPTMFDHYAAIVDEMADDTELDGDRFREFFDGGHVSRFFPMTENRDPTYQDLAKVKCRGATDGAGHNGRTAINIMMYLWRADRGVRLAQRVVELDNLGCDVAVVYAHVGDEVRRTLRTSARQGGIRLWSSRYDFDGDGHTDLHTHEKYMLINGVYNGDTSSWVTTTGSQNWGGGLTVGDDVTVNVSARAVYRDYIENWQFISANGATRIH
jgi:hypothetical protein